MAVLSIHNFYRSSNPSGENLVVNRERELLEASGQAYAVFDRHSDDLLAASAWKRMRSGLSLGPSRARQQRLERELTPHREHCNIIHIHNVWPMLTYDVAVAAKRLGFRVVQTLHNYRLIASDSHFLGPSGPHKPQTEEDRLHLDRMPAMHGSSMRNKLYTRGISKFWQQGIPLNTIDRFICLTNFQRRVFADAGIPEHQLLVKPNFVPAAPTVEETDNKEDFALFVGRLSPEKGVPFLCQWWAKTGLKLKVVGDGPLFGQLGSPQGVEFLGRQPFPQVQQLMAQARFLIHTSNWYETFGLVLVEAMATGTPSLAPDFGVMPEVIEQGRLGEIYADGNGQDLVAKAQRLWERAPGLREPCMQAYQDHYTPDHNRKLLNDIYAQLMAGTHD